MRKFVVDWGQVMLLEHRNVNHDGVGIQKENTASAYRMSV